MRARKGQYHKREPGSDALSTLLRNCRNTSSLMNFKTGRATNYQKKRINLFIHNKCIRLFIDLKGVSKITHPIECIRLFLFYKFFKSMYSLIRSADQPLICLVTNYLKNKASFFTERNSTCGWIIHHPRRMISSRDETRKRDWRRQTREQEGIETERRTTLLSLKHFTLICRRDVLKRMFLIIWKALNPADKVK